MDLSLNRLPRQCFFTPGMVIFTGRVKVVWKLVPIVTPFLGKNNELHGFPQKNRANPVRIV